MLRDWLQGVRKYLVGTCATLAFTAGTSYAADNDELLQRLEQQSREIQELKARLDQSATPLADKASSAPALDAKAVQNIVGDYLKDHPGAGMPAGVQTGWSPSKGFYVDSAPNPSYSNWQDESKIPFELRIRGRIQADYYFYQPTDSADHLRDRFTYPTAGTNSAGAGNPTGQAHANSTPTFSQFELKRVRMIFEGTAFDPNIRYNVQLDGNTRGIDGLAGGSSFQGLANGGFTNPGAGTLGSGIATADHAVRLFGAYIAYDWHPCCGEKGCGVDCCDGTYKYSPTVTFIVGKIKPFFAFEEVLGSATEQMVEYGMTEWFFDADNDNLQTQAGIEAKFLEDRAFLHATLNNAYESQTANRQNQRIPAVNIGGWYDFGGNWNESRKRYDLFGDSLADVDYSCKPVFRVGGATYLAPLDRRSYYTNADIGIIKASTAAPTGTTFTGLFNAGPVAATALASGAGGIDKFDTYNFEAFWALKWRGFSLWNDWFVRDMDNFKGAKLTNGQSSPIFYTGWVPNTNGTNIANALFTKSSLVDIGMALQGGYFIVPKKWEVTARWNWIHGQSGSANGDGTFRTVTVGGAGNAGLGIAPGILPAGTAVRIINGAFDHYHDSNEYAVGVNYYWKRQLLKWQTDFSVYQGGNPASGGASPTGYIPGVDGWLVRTQIQLAF